MALHTAIRQGDIDLVKEILKGKANLLSEKDEHKRTALHVAAANGKVEILQVLLNKSKKIDINVQDEHGWTPLHFAASKGYYVVCQQLLAHKNIKASLQNDVRASPFLYLCKLSLDTSEGSDSVSQFHRTMSAFLSRGTDVNERNKHGDSPLHYAVRCGNTDAVDFLCRHNADVNIINKENETPLLLAVQGRRHENVRCLLEFGAKLVFAEHDYATLNQLASTQTVKLMLTEVFTLQQVMEEKQKELMNVRKKIERDQMILDDLDRTLRREKKSNNTNVRMVRQQQSRIKYQKSLLQNVTVCERMNSQFYTARSGAWVCCMKRIDCVNSTTAQKIVEKIEASTEIEHPNILPLLSVACENSSVHAFVPRPSKTLTELMRTKKECLGEKELLPYQELITMALQIALPLEYLHSHGMVCRAIKSDQIFTILSENHTPGALLIVPYYISKQNSTWSVHEKNTDFYEPAYSVATESRLNHFSFTFASDVWAFGVTLYEMLTLKAPYSNISSGAQVTEYMKMQSPIIPRALRPRRVGPHSTATCTSSLYERYKVLVDIITLCTDIDPVKRPTMTEIVFSLQNNCDINQVIEKKLHTQTKMELKTTMLPQANEWPPPPPKGVYPFHLLPKIMYSPLVKTIDGYVIEAPLQKNSNMENPIVLQFNDACVPFYKNSMAFKMHENYIGTGDDGSVAVISVASESSSTGKESTQDYRAIVRLKERSERILIRCENPKDRFKVLRAHPLVAPFKLQLVKETNIVKELIEFENSQLESKMLKFGVVYCKKGQVTDDEMYSNENGSPEFNQFLHLLGSHVLLEGWDKFRGGLDVASNSTGSQSIFATLEDLEIMFHVSTLLPFDKGNPQQLHRKRHIGNDIVVIIFQDHGCEPFNPLLWTSNFNHVFIIIQPVLAADVKPEKPNIRESMDFGIEDQESVKYQISIVYKDSITIHPRPFLTEPCVYVGDNEFTQFLLTKLVNCERSAMRSSSFEKRLHHVRQQLLSSICSNRKKLKKR